MKKRYIPVTMFPVGDDGFTVEDNKNLFNLAKAVFAKHGEYVMSMTFETSDNDTVGVLAPQGCLDFLLDDSNDEVFQSLLDNVMDMDCVKELRWCVEDKQFIVLDANDRVMTLSAYNAKMKFVDEVFDEVFDEVMNEQEENDCDCCDFNELCNGRMVVEIPMGIFRHLR